MTSPDFAPGFRLSGSDIAVLILGAVGAAAMSPFNPWISGVIVFVVGHFFLFCNVFRLSRGLELAWAACFLMLASGTILAMWPGWIPTFGVSLLITCLVVALEMRRPSYHGVAWQKINPKLRQWWDAQHTAR